MEFRRVLFRSGHEDTGIRAVGQKTIEELGNAVYHSVQRENQSEALLGDAQFLADDWLDDAKVLADEIKSRITNDGENQDPCLPAPVFFGNLLGVRQYDRSRGSRLEGFQEPTDGFWDC